MGTLFHPTPDTLLRNWTLGAVWKCVLERPQRNKRNNEHTGRARQQATPIHSTSGQLVGWWVLSRNRRNGTRDRRNATAAEAAADAECGNGPLRTPPPSTDDDDGVAVVPSAAVVELSLPKGDGDAVRCNNRTSRSACDTKSPNTANS